MTEERARQDAELQGARLEVQGLLQTRTQLEAEHQRLIDRLTSMESKQVYLTLPMSLLII